MKKKKNHLIFISIVKKEKVFKNKQRMVDLSGFAGSLFAIKNVDVLSNDAKNKKNNAGGDIISYRCNIWIKYK